MALVFLGGEGPTLLLSQTSSRSVGLPTQEEPAACDDRERLGRSIDP